MLLIRFLISAVFSVLVTRLFLHIAHNPQIILGSWHIAHLFWGGLFMFISLILLFLYPSEKILKQTSILSGIGWGLYIDELGKFMSRDNNYLFRPAIILIYISFIIVFLIYHFANTKLQKHKTNKTIIQSFFTKLSAFRPLFIILSIYSLYYTFDKIIDIFTIFSSTSRLNTIYSVYPNYNFLSSSDNHLIFIKIGSDIISALLILLGWFFYLSARRRSGLKLFQMSLLINIFIGAVVKFYFEQFTAVFSLAISILVLIYIQSRRKFVK